MRRLEEELGITDLVPEFRDQIEYRADVGNGLIEHELVDVFVAESVEHLRLEPNPDEVMETRWVRIADLASVVAAAGETFTPWMRIYVEHHRDQIFGIKSG